MASATNTSRYDFRKFAYESGKSQFKNIKPQFLAKMKLKHLTSIYQLAKCLETKCRSIGCRGVKQARK